MTESQYQRACDQQAWEEEFIGNRVAWYMRDGGSCDPYSAESFCECLVNDTGLELQETLHPLLKAENLDYFAIGKAICGWVEEKCSEQAAMKAEDELEEMKWQ